MNIFEVHRKTTSRIEPLHTIYLASCLKENPKLLGQFWTLAAADNPDWPRPSTLISVVEEDVLDDGKRVDIVLSNSSVHCLIAVEAKTVDSSVKQGQLNGYLMRLETKYPGYKIWMTYLTPFNTRNQPKSSRGQEAVKEFHRFHKVYPHSSHLSWEEVTKLNYHGDNEVWRQHSEYIFGTICKPPTETVGWGKLADDLGWEIMRDFWQEIGKSGFETSDGIIVLRPHDNPVALTSALKLLLMSEKVRIKAKCPRTVAESVKTALVNSAYGQFHQQVFQLLDEYPFLGIRGTGGYGITLPVKGIHRVVSICTAHMGHPERLTIGRTPK